MKILTVSGSARLNSSNVHLLLQLAHLMPQYHFEHYSEITKLPLFTADADHAPFPDAVLNWRESVQMADAICICTPEYLHNVPALLKNALEWLTSSGELFQKSVLPITFTPDEPRGEKAMQSLIWSLQALEARIVGQLPLYQSTIEISDNKLEMNELEIEILEEAFRLLTGK